MPYGDQSYITDRNAVRVRVWGKADEYLCKCTTLSLKRRSVPTCVILVRAAPAAHPCPPVATLPGHRPTTLPARDTQVSDPHTAGLGPIDAESARASIPTFASASRSRGGSGGEDAFCCPPYLSFYTNVTENRVNPTNLKGALGRVGWAAWAPHIHPHILGGR